MTQTNPAGATRETSTMPLNLNSIVNSVVEYEVDSGKLSSVIPNDLNEKLSVLIDKVEKVYLINMNQNRSITEYGLDDSAIDGLDRLDQLPSYIENHPENASVDISSVISSTTTISGDGAEYLIFTAGLSANDLSVAIPGQAILDIFASPVVTSAVIPVTVIHDGFANGQALTFSLNRITDSAISLSGVDENLDEDNLKILKTNISKLEMLVSKPLSAADELSVSNVSATTKTKLESVLDLNTIDNDDGILYLSNLNVNERTYQLNYSSSMPELSVSTSAGDSMLYDIIYYKVNYINNQKNLSVYTFDRLSSEAWADLSDSMDLSAFTEFFEPMLSSFIDQAYDGYDEKYSSYEAYVQYVEASRRAAYKRGYLMPEEHDAWHTEFYTPTMNDSSVIVEAKAIAKRGYDAGVKTLQKIKNADKKIKDLFIEFSKIENGDEVKYNFPFDDDDDCCEAVLTLKEAIEDRISLIDTTMSTINSLINGSMSSRIMGYAFLVPLEEEQSTVFSSVLYQIYDFLDDCEISSLSEVDGGNGDVKEIIDVDTCVNLLQAQINIINDFNDGAIDGAIDAISTKIENEDYDVSAEIGLINNKIAEFDGGSRQAARIVMLLPIAMWLIAHGALLVKIGCIIAACGLAAWAIGHFTHNQALVSVGSIAMFVGMGLMTVGSILSSLNDMMMMKDQQLAAQKSKIASLQTTMGKASTKTTEATGLYKELELAQARADIAVKNQAKLGGQLNSLSTAHRALVNEHAALETSKAAIEARLKELGTGVTDEIVRLRAELAAVNQDLAATTAKLNASNTLLGQANAAHADYIRIEREIFQQLNQQRLATDSVTMNLRTIKWQIEELQKQANESSGQSGNINALLGQLNYYAEHQGVNLKTLLLRYSAYLENGTPIPRSRGMKGDSTREGGSLFDAFMIGEFTYVTQAADGAYGALNAERENEIVRSFNEMKDKVLKLNGKLNALEGDAISLSQSLIKYNFKKLAIILGNIKRVYDYSAVINSSAVLRNGDFGMTYISESGPATGTLISTSKMELNTKL